MASTGRKPFSPDRRCHWFDSNGRPYKRLDGGLGCPRKNNCYFAHPTDLDNWRSARPSGEPPLQYLTDDEYRLIVGRHRSPGRGFVPAHPNARHRSSSAERDRRRRERSPLGRRRSISREREPTLASRLRGRPPSRERAEVRPLVRNSRSRSPLRSRMQQSQPTPPLPYGSSSAPAVRRTYSSIPDGPKSTGVQGNARGAVVFPKVEAMDVRMQDVSGKQVPARESSIASTHVPSQQLTPARAGIPLPPSTSPSLSTAAPSSGNTTATPDFVKSMLESSTIHWQEIQTAVAAASSAVANQKSQAPGDVSSEEKIKIWTSRIELLAAATRIHNDCRSMENDVKDYKQLVESFSYAALPAEDRTVIEGHMHTLQSQLAQKSDEIKKIVNQLNAAKFWPTYTHKQAPALGQDNVQQEVANEVRTVKESLTQLHEMLQNVGVRWDQLSKELQSNGSANQPSTFLVEAVVPSELGKIRDTLTTMSGRLETIERELSRPRELILEQMDAIVAENVQSLVLASTGTVQAQPPPPRAALTEEQLHMLQTLQQSAALTGEQVKRLSQEVTQLGMRNDQLQTENMQLQGENAQLRQQLEEMQTSQTSSGDSKKIDRMQAEMHALNAAVMAYISHSPNTQQLSNPTADAIVQQITPQIAKTIPELVVPELNAMRNQLQETLRKQQSESALKELSLKMSLTLQAVEAIRGLVGGAHKAPPHNVTSPRPSNAATPVNGTS